MGILITCPAHFSLLDAASSWIKVGQPAVLAPRCGAFSTAFRSGNEKGHTTLKGTFGYDNMECLKSVQGRTCSVVNGWILNVVASINLRINNGLQVFVPRIVAYHAAAFDMTSGAPACARVRHVVLPPQLNDKLVFQSFQSQNCIYQYIYNVKLPGPKMLQVAFFELSCSRASEQTLPWCSGFSGRHWVQCSSALAKLVWVQFP